MRRKTWPAWLKLGFIFSFVAVIISIFSFILNINEFINIINTRIFTTYYLNYSLFIDLFPGIIFSIALAFAISASEFGFLGIISLIFIGIIIDAMLYFIIGSIIYDVINISKNKRFYIPFDIKIISILLYTLGILSFVYALLLIFIIEPEIDKLSAVDFGSFWLILSFILIYTGDKLKKGQTWTRVAIIIIGIFALIFSLITTLINYLLTIILIIIGCYLITYLLFNKNVRQFFKKR